MCSKFSPATAGTKRLAFSALWVRLQRPLYPARCVPSAALSPMTAVRSPAVKLSLVMMVSGMEPDAQSEGSCRTSYRHPARRQFFVRLPIPGAGIMGDGRGEVRANPGQDLQLALPQLGDRSLESQDGVDGTAISADAVEVAVRPGELTCV